MAKKESINQVMAYVIRSSRDPNEVRFIKYTFARASGKRVPRKLKKSVRSWLKKNRRILYFDEASQLSNTEELSKIYRAFQKPGGKVVL